PGCSAPQSNRLLTFVPEFRIRPVGNSERQRTDRTVPDQNHAPRPHWEDHAVTISSRDRRALVLLGGAIVVMAIVYFAAPSGTSVSSSGEIDSVTLAEQRVARLRQLAAVAPARAATMKQVSADLADRERGLIQADTAAQAQAAVLEVAR